MAECLDNYLQIINGDGGGPNKLRIWWPRRVTTEEIQQRLTEEEPIAMSIQCRRRRWIGHALRQPDESNTRQALRWTREKVRDEVGRSTVGKEG